METKKGLLRRLWDAFIDAMRLPDEDDDYYEPDEDDEELIE